MSIHIVEDSIIGVPREEDNSIFLIYPKIYPKPHFINKYVMDLWKESDGKSFQELFEEYQGRYKDVKKETIQSDIVTSIIYLYNLKMVDITGADKEVLESMSINETSIVNEQDFRDINSFILSVAVSPACVMNFEYDRELTQKEIETVYSIPSMRINQIHRKEIFFKIFSSSGELIGVAGVSFRRSVQTCYISSLILKDTGRMESALSELYIVLRSISVKYVKVKTLNKDMVKKFLDNGFRIEAKLDNESDDLSITYVVRRETE